MPVIAFNRQDQKKGAPTSQTETIPAPIGGLNAVDSIAAMAPTDAIIMDNWVPQTTFCNLRNGYTNWSTGYLHWVETLMGYAGLTGTEKLFAINGTTVNDATASGAVGAPVVSGLTNARWEYVNTSAPGGSYLYAANGVDAPLFYDGTSWVKVTAISTPAITGVTTTTLRNPAVWKNRIWFVQHNTNLVWYLPAQSIGGAATSFDLSTQFTLGGSIQTILTFSLSSSTSFDDFIAFLSTEGQMVVYSGTDPNTAGAFAIQGTYYVGKPIGRRPYFKTGSDAIIITAAGLVSASSAIAVGIKDPKDTISYKILTLINNDIAMYSGNFGWEGAVYPFGNKIILNVPQNELSRSHQYVMNTVNDAWCSYGLIASPWNAATFCVLGNSIYFGGSNVVAKCEVGQADAGTQQIFGSIQPAYSYFKTDRQKMFTMVRPLMQTTGNFTPGLALNTDFNSQPPTTSPSFGGTSTPLWNVALWNVSYWATGPFIQKNWQTVTGIGFAGTIYMTVSTAGATINLLSIDYTYKTGGIL